MIDELKLPSVFDDDSKYAEFQEITQHYLKAIDDVQRDGVKRAKDISANYLERLKPLIEDSYWRRNQDSHIGPKGDR